MCNYVLALLIIKIVKYNMQYTASDYRFGIFKHFLKIKEPGNPKESQRPDASHRHITYDCNVYTSQMQRVCFRERNGGICTDCIVRYRRNPTHIRLSVCYTLK